MLWYKILWTDEAKTNFQSSNKRSVWRRKGNDQDPKHTTSVTHGSGNVMVWAYTELVPSYLLMWMPMKSSRNNFEVFWAKSSQWAIWSCSVSQKLQNSLGGAAHCRWTMTLRVLEKQPKSFKAQKWNVMQWSNQSPEPDLIYFTRRQNSLGTSRNWSHLLWRSSKGLKPNVLACLCIPDRL